MSCYRQMEVVFLSSQLKMHLSTVELQCVTAEWVSYTYMFFPLEVTVKYLVWYAVLYSRSLFVIFYIVPHSSALAWKIPWTEEPGGLQSMGLLRVGHDWTTSLSLFTFMHWRRKWQRTPVFLPGESQGRDLVGCCLWSRTESDTTDVT